MKAIEADLKTSDGFPACPETFTDVASSTTSAKKLWAVGKILWFVRGFPPYTAFYSAP
jgi:hypothetical protein